MTIGEKIKMIREFRGMTQKELGIELGFPQKSAQIRVAHYETGFRVPKNDVVTKLCDILNTHLFVFDTDKTSEVVKLIETLMWTEEELKGRMHIACPEFDSEIKSEDQNMKVQYASIEEWKNLFPAMIWFEDKIVSDFLKEWSLKKDELDKGKITQEKYFEWKIHWPVSSIYYSMQGHRQALAQKN